MIQCEETETWWCEYSFFVTELTVEMHCLSVNKSYLRLISFYPYVMHGGETIERKSVTRTNISGNVQSIIIHWNKRIQNIKWWHSWNEEIGVHMIWFSFRNVMQIIHNPSVLFTSKILMIRDMLCLHKKFLTGLLRPTITFAEHLVSLNSMPLLA